MTTSKKDRFSYKWWNDARKFKSEDIYEYMYIFGMIEDIKSKIEEIKKLQNKK